MFVCICNALRERDCQAAAAHPETRCAGCVFRRLGCRVRCGACVRTMRQIVLHAKASEQPEASVYRAVPNQEELV